MRLVDFIDLFLMLPIRTYVTIIITCDHVPQEQDRLQQLVVYPSFLFPFLTRVFLLYSIIKKKKSFSANVYFSYGHFHGLINDIDFSVI